MIKSSLAFSHFDGYSHQTSWLCFFLHLPGPREVIFWKKENQFLKNPKNWFGSFNIEGSPLWIKIKKKSKFFSFLKKKSYFFIWIWIRNVLSFLLMYIFYLLLKISNFVIFCLKNIIFDLCQSGAYNSKKRLYRGPFLVSMESKRSKYLS